MTTAPFWTKVDLSAGPDGCWPWTAHRNPGGYGGYRRDGRLIKAHRFAYQEVTGPIPAGLQLDHLCRNRACCNPAHLEPVTNRENVLRGVGISATNARKTTCLHGHNDWRPDPSRPGHRSCRECKRIRNAAHPKRYLSASGKPYGAKGSPDELRSSSGPVGRVRG